MSWPHAILTTIVGFIEVVAVISIGVKVYDRGYHWTAIIGGFVLAGFMHYLNYWLLGTAI